MTEFDKFKQMIERFGWIGGLAAAGAVFTPLITAAAGFAPLWPVGVPFLTSLFMLIALIIAFLSMQRVARRRILRRIILLSLAFLAFITAYLIAFDTFIYQLPLDRGAVTLGCTWTEDARQVAASQKLDTGCPGSFKQLLGDAENDPTAIWKSSSIRNVKLLLLGLWLGSFVMLAALFGSFVLFLSQKKGGDPAKAEPSGAV